MILIFSLILIENIEKKKRVNVDFTFKIAPINSKSIKVSKPITIFVKGRIFLSCFYIIGCVFLFATVYVYANGVPYPQLITGPYETIVLIFIVFIIAVGFEFLVFTHKNYDIAPRDMKLLGTFFKINFITFPLTQILAYIVILYAIDYYWFYIFGIEILVVLAEWRLILIEFDKKYNRILESRTTLKIVIIANIISFFLGFVPYLLIFPFIMFS